MTPEAFGKPPHAPLPSQSRFQHAFAGLVTLADWIGSDETVFQCPPGALSGPQRIAWATDRASRSLQGYGIDPGGARVAAGRLSLDFRTLFPGLEAPRPAQAALLGGRLPVSGQVTVLEAETGSGKTEAALVHFLRLFRAGKVDGLYFALPTRAAAVQIHARVRDCIRRWLGDNAPPVGLAVPGYLRVDAADGERLPDEHRVLWPDDVQGRTWAVENAKRYLSGAVMVGTIDQVLLGGLRVRHAPFRSGPMLRLLLCIDEVHSSDAYMTRLLRNVLDQHRAAGGHVLLMSATLGSYARLRLLRERFEQHEAPDPASAARLCYPSFQTSDDEDLQELPPDGARLKRVTVELLDAEADRTGLIERLGTATESGAVILFIRNRVRDAIETVQRLERIGAPVLRCQGVIAPHHGRFSPEDRRLLDGALEEAFRARRGVVAVTTQTAEQSLDLDADWLVTDIAPGDVLLQRIGRLHRHERTRPEGFEVARVSILAPTPEQLARTLNAHGSIAGRTMLGLGRVYENIVGVLATCEWLARHGEIRVPCDNRALVEAATHPKALQSTAEALGDPWPGHLRDVEGNTAARSGAASVVAVDWKEPLADNSRAEPDVRAKTRLGLDDRRIELPESRRGPFGEPVRTLNIPGWMAGDTPTDATVTEVVDRDGEIRFRFGSKGYWYSRFGLARAGGGRQ